MARRSAPRRKTSPRSAGPGPAPARCVSARPSWRSRAGRRDKRRTPPPCRRDPAVRQARTVRASYARAVAYLASSLERSAEPSAFLTKITSLCGPVWTTVWKVSEERTSPHSIGKGTDLRDVVKVSGKRRVVAITGAATFLGLNLIGLLEDDPRVGKIVCLDTT